MKVPKSVLVNTGEQEKAYRQINNFFDFIKKEIEGKIHIPQRPSRFEIRVNNLYMQTPLDDTIHMLLYKQRVVACVTETRTEMNYIQFDFFKNLENLD